MLTIAERVSSVTKEVEISNSLDALHFEDFREKDDEDYAALDKLTKRINQFSQMARTKDKDDGARVRFLTRAVVGIPWGLCALQSVSSEPSYQRLVNALYTSMRELDPYESKNTQIKAK